MSYAIESIAKSIGARRVGKHKATIDWLLTDSRSLSFPEETLFFALTTKRNSGARYIPDLYDRGVRNFVITEEDFKEVENGELRVESSMQHDGAQPTLNSQLSTLNLFLVCALEFFQEACVVFGEHTEVFHLIFQVCDTLDTHTEGITAVYFAVYTI